MQTRTGFAPVNRAQIYFEISGEGHPLILLHAGVADGRMWDDQFAVFAQRFRTLRYDLRGFGRSAMPAGRFSHHDDVAGLLDYLQVQRAIVLGISFGGKVAIDFALAYPQRVLALVLAAPTIGGSEPSERVIEFWEQEELAIARGDLDTAVELNLRLWVDGPHRQPGEVNARVRQTVGQMQRDIFQMEIPEDVEVVRLEPAANGRLAEIAAPTLVLVGALDLPEMLEQATWLAEHIPNAQFATISGTAHMLNMEKPEQFNQIVGNFFLKTERRAARIA